MQRLMRGGKFDSLTTLEELGSPKTIVNLRRGPDPTHLAGVRILHVPAEDGVENYDTSQRRVRSWLSMALSTVATAQPPIYVHCTSGRDRTGVVVAATLLLLGVEASVVAEEYMLSDGADLPSIELAIAGVTKHAAELGVDREALRRALGV
jgi:protein-tyrosine phosphatase